MTSELRKERHSVTDLKIHLVCVTKYRRSVFSADGLACIEKAFRSVAAKMNFKIIEFNGESDHVHVAVEYPPKLAVSQIVNHLKGVSSRLYRKAGHPCPSDKALWSPSYYASSVGGAPLNVLKEYIQNEIRLT